MRFLLKVLHPNKAILQDHVEAVRVPAVDGEYELLANHAPIFLALHAGALSFTLAGEAEGWFITGGTCHMRDNECVILVRDVVDVSELNFEALKAELYSADAAMSLERRQLLEALVAYQK